MSLCLISLIVRTSSGKRFQAAGPEYKNASSSFGHCRVDHAIYQSINQSIECKRCNSHSISRLSGLVLVVYIVRKLSYLNDIHVNFALCHFRMLSFCFAVQNKTFFQRLTRRNRGGRLCPRLMWVRIVRVVMRHKHMPTYHRLITPCDGECTRPPWTDGQQQTLAAKLFKQLAEKVHYLNAVSLFYSN